VTKQIIGISSMATRQILAELTGAYEQRTQARVAIQSVGGVDAARRVREGEAFDVVVLADDALAKLEADGHIVPGSRTGLAESAIAVAVRAGAPHPDLSSEAAVKAAVQASKVGYSSGPSGNHLLKLLKTWGIEAPSERVIMAPPGVPVATLVARGEVELGFQQLSEFLGMPGIEIAGPLPPVIQSVTLFACGICTRAANAEDARDLIHYLASSETDAAKRRHGMEPPQR
jgi:molybdate transport system substrate-binding protein